MFRHKQCRSKSESALIANPTFNLEAFLIVRLSEVKGDNSNNLGVGN